MITYDIILSMLRSRDDFNGLSNDDLINVVRKILTPFSVHIKLGELGDLYDSSINGIYEYSEGYVKPILIRNNGYEIIDNIITFKGNETNPYYDKFYKGIKVEVDGWTSFPGSTSTMTYIPCSISADLYKNDHIILNLFNSYRKNTSTFISQRETENLSFSYNYYFNEDDQLKVNDTFEIKCRFKGVIAHSIEVKIEEIY